MASGYGLTGGVSRCYPFWQEYMACYVINHDNIEARKQGICMPKLEDYYECLHHKKEHEHKRYKMPTEKWKLHILEKTPPPLVKYGA